MDDDVEREAAHEQADKKHQPDYGEMSNVYRGVAWAGPSAGGVGV